LEKSGRLPKKVIGPSRKEGKRDPTLGKKGPALNMRKGPTFKRPPQGKGKTLNG